MRKKEKVLIYGAGNFGKALCSYLKNDADILGFIDAYSVNKECMGFPIYNLESVSSLSFDIVFISIEKKDEIEIVKRDLGILGVSEKKIKIFVEDKELCEQVFISYNSYDEKTDKCLQWVRQVADYIFEENISGAVAECGVLRGDFAFFLNKYFYNKELYLFDTFEGFDANDLEIERQIGDEAFLNGRFNSLERFRNTSESIVMGKMLHKENVLLKKGYFPKSAEGVEKDFCFVKLDMDLYQPMYEGLVFFVPRMIQGGVILMHDYFAQLLPGVKKAVHDYEDNFGALHKIPVGDNCSLAIVI